MCRGSLAGLLGRFYEVQVGKMVREEAVDLSAQGLAVQPERLVFHVHEHPVEEDVHLAGEQRAVKLCPLRILFSVKGCQDGVAPRAQGLSANPNIRD